MCHFSSHHQHGGWGFRDQGSGLQQRWDPLKMSKCGHNSEKHVYKIYCEIKPVGKIKKWKLFNLEQ